MNLSPLVFLFAGISAILAAFLTVFVVCTVQNLRILRVCRNIPHDIMVSTVFRPEKVRYSNKVFRLFGKQFGFIARTSKWQRADVYELVTRINLFGFWLIRTKSVSCDLWSDELLFGFPHWLSPVDFHVSAGRI